VQRSAVQRSAADTSRLLFVGAASAATQKPEGTRLGEESGLKSLLQQQCGCIAASGDGRCRSGFSRDIEADLDPAFRSRLKPLLQEDGMQKMA
jgi:hypothetical protein